MPPSGSAPRAERPPATSPERRRNERRSRMPPACVSSDAASAHRRAWRSLFLISMAWPLLAWIPVDAVKGLHVIRFLVARLALFTVGFAVGSRRGCQPAGRRHACSSPKSAQYRAAIDLGLGSALHGFVSC